MKNMRSDVKWGYLSQLLNSGINILILPFVLNALSPDKLGLWYNFTSIGSLVLLLDFGFSTTMTRNVSYAWNGAKEIKKEGFVASDNGQVNIPLFFKIFNVSKIVYFLIALIATVIFFSIGTLYIYNISSGIIATNDYLPAWIVYSSSIIFNIYYAYWTPLLRGIGAIKEHYQVLFFSKLAQLIFSLLGLMIGLELMAVSLAYGLSIVTMRFLSKYFYYKNKKIKNIISISKNEKTDYNEIKTMFLTIWSSVFKQGTLSISNFMIEKSSMIIVTTYYGLTISSQMGLTLQAFGVITTIANVMYNSYMPRMIKYRAKNDDSKAYNILCKTILVQVVLISAGGFAIIIFGNSVLSFIGSQTDILSSSSTLLLTIYLLIFNFQTLCTNYIIMGNVYPMLKAYLITGIGTIIVELLFVFLFKNQGVVVIFYAQILTLLLYNAWKWPMYIAQSQDKKLTLFIKDIFNKTNFRRI